jgi:hypothetical protein
LSAPFADLFAVVVAEVEQLDTGLIFALAYPNNPNADSHGRGKAVETHEGTRDKIAGEYGRDRQQKTVFADIEKQGPVVLFKGNVGGRSWGHARIEATFQRYSRSRGLLRCGHIRNLRHERLVG